MSQKTSLTLFIVNQLSPHELNSAKLVRFHTTSDVWVKIYDRVIKTDSLPIRVSVAHSHTFQPTGKLLLLVCLKFDTTLGNFLNVHRFLTLLNCSFSFLMGSGNGNFL
jgi:hypothetical protein